MISFEEENISNVPLNNKGLNSMLIHTKYPWDDNLPNTSLNRCLNAYGSGHINTKFPFSLVEFSRVNHVFRKSVTLPI